MGMFKALTAHKQTYCEAYVKILILNYKSQVGTVAPKS